MDYDIEMADATEAYAEVGDTTQDIMPADDILPVEDAEVGLAFASTHPRQLTVF
jgi:hypothetical protein